MNLRYEHVDVFSAAPFGGNSLPVFIDCPTLSAERMLAITRELRHFEAVFLQPSGTAGTVKARVFDLIGELPFAGHPLIGAAAALQYRSDPNSHGTWRFALAERTVEVKVERAGSGYHAVLDQGPASYLRQVVNRQSVAAAFDLQTDDLAPDLPVEVASTGLRYLVVPVSGEAIGRARIRTDITALIEEHGAEFAVLFDPAGRELRHWNNDGIVEDIATGSAAGVVAGYCVRHGLARLGETMRLSQGRFVDRPSHLDVQVVSYEGTRSDHVTVGGDVAIVGHGFLHPELGDAN